MDVKLLHDGVPVTILGGPYVADEAPTPAAIEFIASHISRLDEMRRFAAHRKLLRLYNKSWRDGNHPTIDKDEFVAKLANPRLVVYDEIGAAVMYFDDGDMFAGHTVEVGVNRGELTHAGIIG